jgi:hypothetical protein
VKHLELNGSSKEMGKDIIADYVIDELKKYEQKTMSKFIGAGIPYELMKISSQLCSRLWAELDIVPISMEAVSEGHEEGIKDKAFWAVKCVDEQADSMARKCIMWVKRDSEFAS